MKQEKKTAEDQAGRSFPPRRVVHERRKRKRRSGHRIRKEAEPARTAGGETEEEVYDAGGRVGKRKRRQPLVFAGMIVWLFLLLEGLLLLGVIEFYL